MEQDNLAVSLRGQGSLQQDQQLPALGMQKM